MPTKKKRVSKEWVLTARDADIIKKILASRQLQSLIGAEEWDLTENEEIQLWEIIRRDVKCG